MGRYKETKGSRTFPVAVLLTMAGGFLDAYTYSARGGVFANAQTGNIVKLGISIANGDIGRCFQFMLPIMAFTVGVLLALYIDSWLDSRKIPFIRRSVLIIEMFVLLLSMFLPQDQRGNMAANSMISLVCAMQMEAFKQFIGQPIATTVSTGNLRKMVEFLFEGINEKDKEKQILALHYFVIIMMFISGALIGTVITGRYQLYAVSVPVLLLLAGFLEITRVHRAKP